MSRARRSNSKPIPPPLWLAAATLALVGVAFVASNLFGGDDHSGQGPGKPAAQSTSKASTPATATTEAIQPPANPCAAEMTAAEAEVSAVRIAAGHWREHVEARTALLAGQISQATTKAIWKRTRLAGPADIQRLAAATSARDSTRGGCDAAPGEAGKACRHRLTVLAAAATSGNAVARDWKAHLDMMAAHKAGGMDDKHAQAMWVAEWKAAPPNLSAFANADARLAQTAACHPK
jgi:hypothetical protein